MARIITMNMPRIMALCEWRLFIAVTLVSWKAVVSVEASCGSHDSDTMPGSFDEDSLLQVGGNDRMQMCPAPSMNCNLFSRTSKRYKAPYKHVCSAQLCEGANPNTPCQYPHRSTWSVIPPPCAGHYCCLNCKKWNMYMKPMVPTCPCSKFCNGECFSLKCWSCGFTGGCRAPLGNGILCSGDPSGPPESPCCTGNGTSCNLVYDNNMSAVPGNATMSSLNCRNSLLAQGMPTGNCRN